MTALSDYLYAMTT